MSIPKRYLEHIAERMQEDKERLLQGVKVTEKGCWEWQGSVNEDGYGRMSTLGFNGMAHRVAWELFRGDIPDGYHLDHLPFCRNHSCVNPDHLEPVPPRENNHRGLIFRTYDAGTSHCSEGHELVDANVRIGLTGRLHCQVCRATRKEERKQKRREEHPPTPRGAHWAAKTHCPHGHEYSGSNLIVGKDGRRRCRACKKERYLEGREKEKRPAITHCRQGHEYTPENIYWVGKNKNTRVCRICAKARIEEQRQRERELQPPRPLGCGQSSKTHCPAGHPYDEVNTGVTKTGSRYCRACARERARQKKQENT